MDKYTKIGWVGTGVMGLSMCGRLLDAGYQVNVHSRTASRAQPLIEKGALWCDSPADVSNASDVIVTMVGTPDEVRSVYMAEKGLFSVDVSAKKFVDMSTTVPDLSMEIYATAKKKKADAVDAPVSGGDIGARNGSLSIMAGGDEAIVSMLTPLFDCLGNVMYMGKAGSGQHSKMCNQITVAGTMIGVCEALVYAQKAGLDCTQLVAAIRPGAAGCWALENLAPRILKKDYAPGFMVNHFIKDLGIALKQAQAMKINLPGLALANKLYRETQSIGQGESGTQALILAIRQLSFP